MNRDRIGSCLPERLHPFSRNVLDLYLSGALDTAAFLRWFHMPNSTYLPVAECIVARLDPAYRPGAPDRARRSLRG
ncbi:hypothetical protein HW532_02660 [Kaustia mangrovi]|uniref:Uncharacterized protein n=1 Tax=Kaustia mangrovi TaxID=2593653 RepID=A0A7S8HAL7_9HYPH|nr:hypothetical protein [Kaustia mangrovi]QPC41715.1 hypothetical protein HW532_02660 [Kaustia mangrovi]